MDSHKHKAHDVRAVQAQFHVPQLCCRNTGRPLMAWLDGVEATTAI